MYINIGALWYVWRMFNFGKMILLHIAINAGYPNYFFSFLFFLMQLEISSQFHMCCSNLRLNQWIL